MGTTNPQQQQAPHPFPLSDRGGAGTFSKSQGTAATDRQQTWTRAVVRRPSRRSCPPHASRSDTTLTKEELDKGWEGGKLESTLDAALLDQDWVNLMPLQWTPFNASHLLPLLVEAGYDNDKTHYLVDRFRQGFHLRLDQPIHQIVKDRQANIRMVKGKNKTTLASPRAVEEKLMKELRDKMMIRPFLRAVVQAYMISPLGL